MDRVEGVTIWGPRDVAVPGGLSPGLTSNPGTTMLALYIFLLLLGGGLAGLSLFGDVFGGTELDAEALGDPGLDVGPEGAEGDWWKAFSLQGLLYGAMGAGGTGTLLHLIWGGERPLLTGMVAGGTGFACGVLATFLMSYLKRSGSGGLLDESTFEGLTGTVTLPLRPDVPGRIRVRRGEREHVLRALPYGTDAAGSEPTEGWQRVVVVEVRDGVAYVTPAGPELEALNP